MDTGCNPFWIYKEDIEMKDSFFADLDRIETDWTCYSNEANREVYTKPEP